MDVYMENILIKVRCQLGWYATYCGWVCQAIFYRYHTKKQYQPSTDILRISVKYQKYRYAKKTQISLDLKKYRYVGDICGFR